MVSQFRVNLKIKKLFKTSKKTTRINIYDSATNSKVLANNSSATSDNFANNVKQKRKFIKPKIQIKAQTPMTNKLSSSIKRNMTHVENLMMKLIDKWQSKIVHLTITGMLL